MQHVPSNQSSVTEWHREAQPSQDRNSQPRWTWGAMVVELVSILCQQERTERERGRGARIPDSHALCVAIRCTTHTEHEMGCDIHLYKEKFVDGQWLAADKWQTYDYGDDDKGIEVPWQERFTARDYNLFGLLAKGVRREHPFSFEPRGLPFDPCQEIASVAEKWGEDGHSHSYLFLHELKAMAGFIKKATINITGMKHRDELDALHASISSGNPDWNLIFPYCQSTNARDHIDFAIDVPADFYFGESLNQIIGGFDGIDGDNHRIVFFFDN
jgi:hypothetical protein